MKKIFFLLLCSFFVASLSYGQCKARAIVKFCKADLKPFKYDAYAMNEIEYKSEKQIVPVEFTALQGNEYKLVFCTSELPLAVGITIYDKPKYNKKRKILYFDENSKDGFLCAFKPEKTGTFYIEYSVPASKDPKKGCVVMLIGLK